MLPWYLLPIGALEDISSHHVENHTHILSRYVDVFQKRFGNRWKPAPLLKSLVCEGKSKWPK